MKTTKIKRNRNGLGELRESLGLSQKLMALYLKINLSTVKLVETGRRLLPTHALITVANLEIQQSGKKEQNVYNAIHPLEQIFASGFREKIEDLTYRKNKCQEEEKLLSRQLAVMKSNYIKFRARLQIIETFIKENAESQTDLQEWQAQINIIIGLLTKCGLPLQLITQVKLDLLNNEIQIYHNLTLQLKTNFPEML